MTPEDRQFLNARRLNVQSQMTGQAGRAVPAATQPINTSTGPASAPGLLQLGILMDAQTQATLTLVDVLRELVARA